jgi:hypothetical protein
VMSLYVAALRRTRLALDSVLFPERRPDPEPAATEPSTPSA